MLAWELVVEAQALRSQGWTVSAIARHLGVTRSTVRRYLSGEQTPGMRARSAPDPFAEYVEYCRLRLAADPHLWATTLFDEVTALGYSESYPSFTRAIRQRALRPVCAACKQNASADRASIEHPPGAETQWDWVELPDPPTGWGWNATAYVLIGALPHSGRWRGWLAESTDQPHLVEGLDAVARRLGGLSRRWRFDRMSTVAQPQSGRLQVSFGPIARHYAVGIDVCPAYHAWRKGAVEKAAGVITQRWCAPSATTSPKTRPRPGWTGCVCALTDANAAVTVSPPRWGRWLRPRGCGRYLRVIPRCWKCRAR